METPASARFENKNKMADSLTSGLCHWRQNGHPSWHGRHHAGHWGHLLLPGWHARHRWWLQHSYCHPVLCGMGQVQELLPVLMSCHLSAKVGGKVFEAWICSASACGATTAQWYIGSVASMTRSIPINYSSNLASMMLQPSTSPRNGQNASAMMWTNYTCLQWTRKTGLRGKVLFATALCSLLCSDGSWRSLADCTLIKIWIWWWWNQSDVD